MTTIRPNLHPQTHQRPQNPDSAKLAAQRAFFSAVTSQTQAPAQTAPSVALAASGAPPAQRVAATPAEQPAKILRPGSLLDIRV